MVIVVQLVRMSDCGSEGRQFEPDQSPKQIFEGQEGCELGSIILPHGDA